jgi:hypothetical protein
MMVNTSGVPENLKAVSGPDLLRGESFRRAPHVPSPLPVIEGLRAPIDCKAQERLAFPPELQNFRMLTRRGRVAASLHFRKGKQPQASPFGIDSQESALFQVRDNWK